MGLNPYNIWFPLFALLGVVLIAPAMQHWVLPMFYGRPEHTIFLASMVLPFLVLLIGASWLNPG